MTSTMQAILLGALFLASCVTATGPPSEEPRRPGPVAVYLPLRR